MKRLLIASFCALLLVGCGGGKTENGAKTKKGPERTEKLPKDSTLYGTCGDGSTAKALKLINSMNDTLTISLMPADSDSPTLVAGGMMEGDRLAVTAMKSGDELIAQRVLNLTSLLGRWESIDKSFELTEGGEVNPLSDGCRWTKWRILNGHLLLQRDTFDVAMLNVDTLMLETDLGLYVYTRIRQNNTHAEDEDRERERREKEIEDSLKKENT